MLERYERLRTRLGGIAVARLEGTRCGGCHLDLSTAERDEVRTVPEGQFADCPQCGRLLVP
jgi:predicted  nucleic acid-binding Zn-ribbon protein